jgi:WD40 repeat protein
MFGNYTHLRYSQLLVHLIKESAVYLLTGGDDNAIHLTEVRFADKIACQILASVLDAHTSTITGVLGLGNFQFLSVGIDQIIKIWEFNGEDILCWNQLYTFVPDVCGVVEIGFHGRNRRFVVFGTGMEMIAWEELENLPSKR